jgi:hypothetical protein
MTEHFELKGFLMLKKLKNLIVHSRGWPWLITAWAMVAFTGCESTDPGDNGTTRPPAELNILRLAQSTPPLSTDSVGFYALFDEDREVRIDINGNDYFKFRVRDGALKSRPDGSPFGPGDSIFISIKVVDPQELLFDFQPAGLKFNTDQPAELSLDYDWAGETVPGDYNGDNVVNAEDDALEDQFFIWRQGNPGQPFVRLGSAKVEDLNEINADITSFSRFALAY